MMDQKTPGRLDRREDDHGEELEKSKDVGFGPHILLSRNSGVIRC